jgi:hypothetical protein
MTGSRRQALLTKKWGMPHRTKRPITNLEDW